MGRAVDAATRIYICIFSNGDSVDMREYWIKQNKQFEETIADAVQWPSIEAGTEAAQWIASAHDVWQERRNTGSLQIEAIDAATADDSSALTIADDVPRAIVAIPCAETAQAFYAISVAEAPPDDEDEQQLQRSVSSCGDDAAAPAADQETAVCVS